MIICINLFNDKNVCLLKLWLYLYFLQAYESDVQLLPSPLLGNVDLLMDLLCVSKVDSTVKAYYAGFMRWKKGAVTNDINMLDIFTANPFYVAIYLSSLVQTSRTGSSVTTAFYNLHWAHTVIGKSSPTESLIVKKVFEDAKRQ
jgi:hypothetical protein